MKRRTRFVIKAVSYNDVRAVIKTNKTSSSLDILIMPLTKVFCIENAACPQALTLFRFIPITKGHQTED